MGESLGDELKLPMEELCRRLNVDAGTCANAWSTFAAVSERYPLKGDNLHWLACALYVACHTAVMPTVQGSAVTHGNRITISHIARAVGLSLLEFFQKLQLWTNMASNQKWSGEVSQHVQLLNDQFRMILNVSRKYNDVFHTIMCSGNKEPARRSSRQPCTSHDVQKFCWVLFLLAKSSLGGARDSLVNSYHLLLCVMDTVLLSVFTAERENLVREDFRQLLAHEESTASLAQDGVNSESFIAVLCKQFNGNMAEALHIRDTWWRPYLNRLLEQNVLVYGKTPSDFLGVAVFCQNSKHVNGEYEHLMLSEGAPDERELLGSSSTNVSTPLKLHTTRLMPTAHIMPKNLTSLFEQVSCSPRPITMATQASDPARTPVKTQCTPVSDALHNLDVVKAMIKGVAPFPSDALRAFFDKHGCSSHTLHVVNRVQRARDLFFTKYTQSMRSGDVSVDDEAHSIQQMATRLYYKMLQTLLEAEKSRAGHRFDLQGLLGKDIFHLSLISCCLHIVLVAKSPSERQFPWILEAMNVQAYDFVKVIESVVRHEHGLSSSLVRHLRMTEEVILDSLSWRSDSPLYVALDRAGRVFRFEEVAIPNTTEFPCGTPAQSSATKSLNHEKHARLQLRPEVQRSLFTNSSLTPTDSNTPAPRQCDFPDGLTTLSEVAAMTSASGAPVKSPVHLSYPTTPTSERTPDKSPTQSRVPCSSLALFLRKVYHLVSLRLKLISSRLELSNELQQKVWTCFEHILITHTDQFKDRHVDQFLLCSIYAVCKAHHKQVDFVDIMTVYQFLPHSTSHTYRSVCLQVPISSACLRPVACSPDCRKHPGSTGHTACSASGNICHGNKPLPSCPDSAPGSAQCLQQKYADIIEFYNNVFLALVEDFVLRLSGDSQMVDQLHLSPMPSLPRLLHGRQKISAHHQIYLTPHKRRHPGDSPRSTQTLLIQSLAPQGTIDSQTSKIVSADEEQFSPSKRLFLHSSNSVPQGTEFPTSPKPRKASPVKQPTRQRSLAEERLQRLAEKRWQQHRAARGVH